MNNTDQEMKYINKVFHTGSRIDANTLNDFVETINDNTSAAESIINSVKTSAEEAMQEVKDTAKAELKYTEDLQASLIAKQEDVMDLLGKKAVYNGIQFVSDIEGSGSDTTLVHKINVNGFVLKNKPDTALSIWAGTMEEMVEHLRETLSSEDLNNLTEDNFASKLDPKTLYLIDDGFDTGWKTIVRDSVTKKPIEDKCSPGLDLYQVRNHGIVFVEFGAAYEGIVTYETTNDGRVDVAETFYFSTPYKEDMFDDHWNITIKHIDNDKKIILTTASSDASIPYLKFVGMDNWTKVMYRRVR